MAESEEEIKSLLMKVKEESKIELCHTLCDPMDCSASGFPVNQLPELA